jgi:cation:H+ antiporter
MITAALLTVLSFGLLFVGAELLVRGGAGLALRLGLTALVVGLTVVAYGTSSPELLVSIKAAMAGQAGIAVGNVIGSNIFNIAVILGIAALIKPIGASSTIIRRDGPVMVGVTLLGLFVLRDSVIERWEGCVLLSTSAIYTWWIIRHARGVVTAEGQEEGSASMVLGKGIGLILAGLLILALGSQLLVENAVVLARAWGVSEAVIGLTVIAAGTSMPELATSVVGAIRGQSDISLGNVVGSNIFNILFVLGLASVIHPIQALGIRSSDQWFMLGVAVVLTPLMWTGKTIGRKEGLLLLSIYGAYLWMVWPKA